MQRGDSFEHVRDAVVVRAFWQMPAHAEGEFRFRNFHIIAGEGNAFASIERASRKQAACERPIHLDVSLPGRAGRCNLPADRALTG
jgi:hypothetical protein